MLGDLLHRQLVSVLINDVPDGAQQLVAPEVAMLLPPSGPTICERFHVTDGIRYCR